MTNQEMNSNDQNKQEKIGWYSWVVALLCLCTYAVSFISRNIWSTAIPVAAPDLGISMTQAGGLVTAYYVGYVAMNFFSGFFVDKFGPRKSLAVSSLLKAVFTLAIPFSRSYTILFILRVLAGMASGPLFSGCAKMNLGWFDDKRRATAMGFIMTGPALGNVIASGVFPSVITGQGWQMAFTYGGIIALAVAVLFFTFAKERGVAKASGSSVQKTPEEKQKDRQGAFRILTTRTLILATLAQFLAIGANNGFTTWIMKFFVDTQGFTLAAAGGIFAASSAMKLFSGTLSGIASDLLKSRKKVAILCGVITCITVVCLTQFKDTAILWVIMLIYGLFSSGLGNPVNTMATETAKGPFAGTVMGIYNALCQLGSVVFPALLGMLLDIAGGSFFVVLMVIAVSYLIAAVSAACMKETYGKTSDEIQGK